MAEKFININTLEMRYWKKVMEELGEKGFPTAVRNTLNNMAFSMRGPQGFIEKRSHKEFEYRRNNTFIRSLTWVDKAKGINVNSMSSVGGIYAKNGRDKAANRLPSQESATPLHHPFTPLPPARSGGSKHKNVLPRYKLDKMKDYIDVTNLAPNDRMRAMIVAAKLGEPIKLDGKRNGSRGRSFVAMPYKKLERVKHIRKDGKTTHYTRVKLKFLYRQNKNNMANLKKKRPFVQQAGQDAFDLFPQIWGKELDKAIQKLKRK